MKETATDGLLRQLVTDLAEYPETWVTRAIEQHRKASSYWPCLANLVKHMQPAIDAQARRQASADAKHKAYNFVQAGHGEGSQLTETERKAIVREKLGYEPGKRAIRLERSKLERDCERAGIEVKHLVNMSESQVAETLTDKSKPWHNPMKLRESSKRLAAYMDERHPKWRYAE